MTTLQRATAAAASALSFLLTLSLAGCAPAPNANAPATNANAANTASATNANAATTTASPAATNGANDQPVTLAVLDALFAQESFAADLKSRLQLSDEQIARLRKTAEEEHAGLRESDGGGAQSASTRGAAERARQQIAAAVGADKADQVLAFARERWSGAEGASGGGASMTASAEHPNAAPGDTRVVVNAPAFRMDIFEQGRLVKSYKVGIGYPEFPLPAGMRKAEQIIFNPEWTPPDEPWVEAPGSKVKVGEKVPSGSKLNPLGPVKIPIGLPSLIHGGKNPARLGEFASHGCVGLTDQLSLEVAREIAQLGGTEVSEDDIKEYQKDRTKPKPVRLSQPVLVELRYETIVATDDGKLHIYRDVYDRGTNTEENLRRVLQAHGVSFDQLPEQQRAQLLDGLRQMARDALGNPAEGGGTESAAGKNENAAGKNQNATGKNQNASNKNENSSNKNVKTPDKSGKNANDAQGGHVTRNVKGQKEVVVEIEGLRGKGYPAPVGDAFNADARKQKATAPKKGKR